jgi:hypothetical protein
LILQVHRQVVIGSPLPVAAAEDLHEAILALFS